MYQTTQHTTVQSNELTDQSNKQTHNKNKRMASRLQPVQLYLPERGATSMLLHVSHL